ncbi:MAG: 2-hydroxy-3-oxopropionate reductase [Dehalococcoidia bacterium]|nr:2-hydroxy-3-oxopropionate reductase [Dehalococcoidia bacterium]
MVEGVFHPPANSLIARREITMANLGFIGLGIMGKPMAGHLIAAGHTLHVYDLNPAPVRELASKGAVACTSSKQVAQKSDIIITIVPDTPDEEAVLFGKDGVAEGLRPGAIVVDMSSISPIATKEFAHRLEALGAKMLDAPVSGGQVGAQNATLSIMVGGPTDLFNQINPYFQLMGKNIVHVGGHGDGQTCKVANQIVVALTIEAVAEALLFASKAGADPAKVRLALLGGFAQSRILEIHGQRMLDRSFAPGFRIRLHQKDLNLALQGARSLGLSLPNTATAQELFNAVAAQGDSDLDHSAMLLALEKLANHKISG